MEHIQWSGTGYGQAQEFHRRPELGVCRRISTDRSQLQEKHAVDTTIHGGAYTLGNPRIYRCRVIARFGTRGFHNLSPEYSLGKYLPAGFGLPESSHDNQRPSRAGNTPGIGALHRRGERFAVGTRGRVLRRRPYIMWTVWHRRSQRIYGQRHLPHAETLRSSRKSVERIELSFGRMRTSGLA